MSTQKKYYPQLDAIRGISVLAVFTYHAYKPAPGNSLLENFSAFSIANMGMGLDVFFILSSFLLTLLGMNEYERNGKFSLRKYFIRRILRIWPLYYLLMFFVFVILTTAQSYTGYQLTLAPPVWYLLFISNFYLADHVFFLRLLWTLSVEEQFYLFWGVCLLFFQKRLLTVILLSAIFSAAFIIIQTGRGIGIYFHTMAYIIDMMAGAYAAYSLKKNNRLVLLIKNASKFTKVLFYLFLPFLFFVFFYGCKFVSGVERDLLEQGVRCLFIIWCSLLIIDQMINTNAVINLSNKKLLIYTGKISYGLYCLHGFVISFGLFFLKKINFHFSPLFTAFGFLTVTYLLASISYFLIEKPFLKLKDRLYRI